MSEQYLKIDELKQMIEEIKKNDLIPIESMPEYDLLISQVEDFFNKKHKMGEDYIITKNMIQNYIKDDIMLKPTDGKKKGYNKNHIIFVSLIRSLKSIMQTNKIRKIFKPIFKDMGTTEDDVVPLSDVYSTFLTLNNQALDFYAENIDINFDSIEKLLPNNLNLDEGEKKNVIIFLAVMNLLAQASARKRLAEKIIEKYF